MTWNNFKSPTTAGALAAGTLVALAIASACGDVDNRGEGLEPDDRGFEAFDPDPPPDFPIDENSDQSDRLLVVSPVAETAPPRNAPIVLGGPGAANLHADPPHFEISASVDGEPIDLLLDGNRILPLDGLWPAEEWVEVRVQAGVGNDCPDCFIDLFSVRFADRVDVDPPDIDDLEIEIQTTFRRDYEVEARLERRLEWKAYRVLGRVPNGAPFVVAEDLFVPSPRFARRTGDAAVLRREQIRKGDEVNLAVTVIDHLDRESRPRIFRSQLNPGQGMIPACELASAVVPHSPLLLPTNGRLQVDFLVDAVPLALEDESGIRIPLYPEDEVSNGLVLVPAESLSPEATYALVAERCPLCLCPTCGDDISATIETGASDDDIAPSPPVLLSLRDDNELSFDLQACKTTAPAVVVTIEPGVDDRTPSLELRYDAIVRNGVGAGTRIGQSLVPVLQDDGTHAIRLNTGRFSDLLDTPGEFTLIAFDLARNSSRGSFDHEPGGCTQTSSATSALVLLLLAGLGTRARMRRRARQNPTLAIA